jgi:hypothetical protein
VVAEVLFNVAIAAKMVKSDLLVNLPARAAGKSPRSLSLHLALSNVLGAMLILASIRLSVSLPIAS